MPELAIKDEPEAIHATAATNHHIIATRWSLPAVPPGPIFPQLERREFCRGAGQYGRGCNHTRINKKCHKNLCRRCCVHAGGCTGVQEHAVPNHPDVLRAAAPPPPAARIINHPPPTLSWTLDPNESDDELCEYSDHGPPGETSWGEEEVPSTAASKLPKGIELTLVIWLRVRTSDAIQDKV